MADKGKRRTLIAAEFIGGYEDKKKSMGMLGFYENTIEYKVLLRRGFEIQISEIKNISVEAPDQASKRVTATRLIGLGVFAFFAKKNVKESYITLELNDGQEVMFHINGMTTQDVRAKLSSVTAQYKSA